MQTYTHEHTHAHTGSQAPTPNVSLGQRVCPPWDADHPPHLGAPLPAECHLWGEQRLTQTRNTEQSRREKDTGRMGEKKQKDTKQQTQRGKEIERQGGGGVEEKITGQRGREALKHRDRDEEIKEGDGGRETHRESGRQRNRMRRRDGETQTETGRETEGGQTSS